MIRPYQKREQNKFDCRLSQLDPYCESSTGSSVTQTFGISDGTVVLFTQRVTKDVTDVHWQEQSSGLPTEEEHGCGLTLDI